MITHSLIKGTAVIASLTLVSRVLGFLRDLVFAGIFGAGIITDAFVVAFRLPNLLRSMLAEGAFTSAFIPVFNSEQNKGTASAQSLFQSMLALLIFATLIISALGITFSEQLIRYTAPGFIGDSNAYLLCIELTQIMFPYILFVSILSLINGALNTRGIYGASSWGQIVMNCVMALGALLAGHFNQENGIKIVAYSVLIGGIFQLIIQTPALYKAQLRLIPRFPILTKETKEILKLMLPAIFGSAVYQIAILINTLLASLLPSGSVSWLFYSDRLIQLPFGLFSVALGSTLLPLLTQAYQSNNHTAFSQNLNNSLRYSSFLLIPISCLLFVLAHPICEILFERGKFTSFDTLQTSFAIQAGAFGLWGISCTYMLMRALIATKDTVTPTLLGILNLLVTLLISFSLMGPVRTFSSNSNWLVSLISEIQQYVALGDLRHSALALSAGLANTILLPLNIWLVESRTKTSIPLWSFIKPAALFMLISFLLINKVGVLLSFSNPWLDILIASISIGAAFIFFSYIFKLSELQETFALIRRSILRK